MFLTPKETEAAIHEIQDLTGYSFNEIARETELSVPTITRLAHGQSRPTLETRHKINVLLKRMRRRAVNRERAK